MSQGEFVMGRGSRKKMCGTKDFLAASALDPLLNHRSGLSAPLAMPRHILMGQHFLYSTNAVLKLMIQAEYAGDSTGNVDSVLAL